MTLKRSVRIAGTGLIVAGLLMLAWVFVVWRWQDPFTALYTHWKQHQLAHSYEQRFAPTTRAKSRDRSRSQRRVTARDRAGGRTLSARLAPRPGDRPDPRAAARPEDDPGQRHGRLDLAQGPRPRSPHLHARRGAADLHRRAPDDLPRAVRAHRQDPGRRLVTLEVPYGTFSYRVYMHRIVDANDLAVLHSHGREVVALQACHPRFFATNRYIVCARLVRSARGVGGDPRAGHGARRSAARRDQRLTGPGSVEPEVTDRRAGREPPSPRGTSTSASAPAARAIMCDSCPAAARARQSPLRRPGSAPGRARPGPGCVSRQPRAAPAGTGEEDRRGPGARARRAARTARSRRATRPGSRAARRPACAPGRRTTTGLPGLTATRQKTSSTPSSAPIRRTRSCGPTDTPPEVTSRSASRPRESASRCASSSSATAARRSTRAPADASCAARISPFAS